MNKLDQVISVFNKISAIIADYNEIKQKLESVDYNLVKLSQINIKSQNINVLLDTRNNLQQELQVIHNIIKAVFDTDINDLRQLAIYLKAVLDKYETMTYDLNVILRTYEILTAANSFSTDKESGETKEDYKAQITQLQNILDTCLDPFSTIIEQNNNFQLLATGEANGINKIV